MDAAHGELGVLVSGRSRLLVPLDGGLQIGIDFGETLVVDLSETVHGVGVALVRGGPEPFQSGDGVLGDPLPLKVHESDRALGDRVALLRAHGVESDGLRMALADAFGSVVVQLEQPGAGGGVPLLPSEPQLHDALLRRLVVA